MNHLREVTNSFGLLNNDSFLAFLSEVDLNNLGSTDENKSASILDPRTPLEVLHPSWVKWKIVQLPNKERSFFEPLHEKIMTSGAIPEEMRVLLLSHLFNTQEDYALPDKSHVTDSPLAVLLDKPRGFFDSLFMCMGCHFLAQGLRKVIGKKEIDKVLNSLDITSQRYLRKLLFAPKKMAVATIEVKSLEDQPEALKIQVFESGKQVFEQLLKAQSDEFRWYFFRRYEVEFAQELSYQKMDTIEGLDPKSVDAWNTNVCMIVKYLETVGE